MSALDTQIGGGHYRNGGIQPVEYIESNRLGFLEGCVVKRLTRHHRQGGKGRQDIEKAIHELQLLLELRYAVTPTAPYPFIPWSKEADMWRSWDNTIKNTTAAEWKARYEGNWNAAKIEAKQSPASVKQMEVTPEEEEAWAAKANIELVEPEEWDAVDFGGELSISGVGKPERKIGWHWVQQMQQGAKTFYQCLNCNERYEVGQRIESLCPTRFRDRTK